MNTTTAPTQLPMVCSQTDAELASMAAATGWSIDSVRAAFSAPSATDILNVPCGSAVMVYGEIMTVVQRRSIEGTQGCEQAVLTGDGRRFVPEWNDTDWSASSVSYARWTPEGRVAHGFIDSISRKIVQTG